MSYGGNVGVFTGRLQGVPRNGGLLDVSVIVNAIAGYPKFQQAHCSFDELLG